MLVAANASRLRPLALTLRLPKGVFDPDFITAGGLKFHGSNVIVAAWASNVCSKTPALKCG